MSIEVGWDSLVWNKDKNLDQEVPYWITLQKKKKTMGEFLPVKVIWRCNISGLFGVTSFVVTFWVKDFGIFHGWQKP